MKIYIASSWKNQHGVELLTAALRGKGHEVVSWIENNYGEDYANRPEKFDFEDWMLTEESERSFKFDTNGAMTSDLCIYYGPAGKDATAEIAMAWAKDVPVIGLWAKGEDLGLMRKMMSTWHDRIHDLLNQVDWWQKQFELVK